MFKRSLLSSCSFLLWDRLNLNSKIFYLNVEKVRIGFPRGQREYSVRKYEWIKLQFQCLSLLLSAVVKASANFKAPNWNLNLICSCLLTIKAPVCAHTSLNVSSWETQISFKKCRDTNKYGFFKDTMQHVRSSCEIDNQGYFPFLKNNFPQKNDCTKQSLLSVNTVCCHPIELLLMKQWMSCCYVRD